MYPIPIPEYPGYYIDEYYNVWNRSKKRLKLYMSMYSKLCPYYFLYINKKKTRVFLWEIEDIYRHLELRPTSEEIEGYNLMMNEMNARGEFDK